MYSPNYRARRTDFIFWETDFSEAHSAVRGRSGRDTERLAAIDSEQGSGDHTGRIADEVEDGIGHFLGGNHSAFGAGDGAGVDNVAADGEWVGLLGQVVVHDGSVADGARTDSVDSDPVDGVRQREGAGETIESNLTRGIEWIVCTREETGIAGGVDDAASPTLSHMRNGELRTEEGPFQIGVEAAVPEVLGDVVDLSDLNDTGVADEDVEAPMFLSGVVNQCL